MEAVDLPLAGKLAGRIGCRLQLAKKRAQTRFHVRLQPNPVAAQKTAGILVQSGKIQPVPQAASLRSTRPFCLNVLNQLPIPAGSALSNQELTAITC
ncbi:hypothetical protein RvVAT039_14150 [Agrobacterium vitis]|nr:hypothetical protein RvVAT039_14150 [Agrobacterium vitis]